MEDLRARVRAIVSEHADVPATDDATLELDSLTVVTIVEALEDAFDVRFAARDASPETFASIAALARVVAAKRVAP